MTKGYSSKLNSRFFFLVLLSLFTTTFAIAQTTTLTTLPNPPYNGGNSLGSPSQVSFVLNNTNAFPVNLTGLGQWCTTTENGSVWQLYYTATALTGAATDVTAAPWVLVAASSATTVTAAGITPLNFPGLSFTIPAGTQYRFALRNTGPGNTRYSGTGTGLSPNTFTGGGVSLLTGDAQIGGANVGYSGSGTALTLTPRHFTGSVSFSPAGPCTSPPTAGTATPSINPACSGASFNVSLSGGTGGTGQTYQWQSSANGTTWTNIAGATNSALTTSQTSDTYYRAMVTCGGNTSTSAAVLVTTDICYCPSIPTSIADEEIFSVTVNGATNAYNCSTVAPGPGSILNRYSNFYPLGALTNLLPGTSVPFTVVQDECDGATYFSNGCAIWIDFNRDGDFDDPGEQVYVENATTLGPRTITGNLAIPITATAGLTGMRIIVAENNSGAQLQPCMSYTYGETEDYLVNILSLVPCSGTPTAGTAVSSKANACLGDNFTLNVTGSTVAAGITYQWQSSPDNTTWTNIAGATSLSYNTSQSATSYYRIIVTCTNGGATAASSSVMVFTPSLVSGTFTINSALATGGTNFQSFNDAYDYIKCGIGGPVVFDVNAASGPYNEQLIMTPVPGASVTNTVTFNGNGRTINYLSTNTNERAVIKLNGADHIKFDNLVITALGALTGEYGFGVQLINDADSNAVTNCVINITDASTSTNFAGIVVSASNTSATTTGNTLCDGNLFIGNSINGGYYGFTLVGSSTQAVRDNIFSKNIVKDYYFYGTYISGNFNTVIDSNVYSRPARTSVSTFHGVYVTSLNVSLKITRNTFTNPFGGNPTSTSAFYAVYFTGTDALAGLENKVINNKVYNLTGAGEVSAFYNSSSDNVWYQHNTLLLDGAGGSGTQLTRGFYQTTTAAGIRLENNIIVISRQSSGAKYTLYFNTAGSDIVSNYNDLYLNPIATNAFTGFLGSAQLTLANWRTASLQDANSVANNPLFVNAVSGNLLPTNASIDNLGTPLGVTNDIRGISRSTTTPDLGAYEFTPGNCVDPPTPGTATANPNVVCVNTSVNLGVTGNSIGLGQTYQWQSSSTLAGPYTNFGASLTNPVLNINATTTTYYRVAVTCNGATEFSAPVLLTVNPAFPGGTYTINAGSPTTPGVNYASFNDAKAALECGIAGPVIFNVVANSGPYNEQLVLDSIAGTSAINTITFNGNGNSINFSSSVTDERAVIKLRGADHITFDSLTINADGPNAYGWGVQLFNNADSNVINNCTIITSTSSTSTNYAGIVISNSETSATTGGNTLCDGNRITNNTITGGYYGITLIGGTTSTTTPVMDNIIKGNSVSDFYFYGIYLSGNLNTLVESNIVSRPARTSTSTFYGIYVAGNSAKMNVTKNRITDPFGGNTTSTSVFYGLYITASDATAGTENIFSNNLIYGLNGAGTQYAIYNSSSDYAKYFHNTIDFNDPANTSTNATYGFYQVTTADGIEVKNNIFSLNRGGSSNVTAIYRATSTSDIVSDYNNFFRVGTNTRVGYDGSYRITLADWRASTGMDMNSLATNPVYTNPAQGNYKPFSAVLDDKGTPVGITSDIENITRSTTVPDIGAYEFTIPPCTAPPSAGSAVAFPNTGICLGASIDLSLSGSSFGSGQTYQWQYATSATGPWTNLGGARQFADTTIFATGSFYYRALVTCSGNTTTSGSAQVTLNPAFLAGTYTINKTIPASAVNFTSFTTAVAALECGITGPVFFDVAPDTYTEQIRMRSVAGTSPTVRVTFRSANADPASVTLTHSPTLAANYTLMLDSASYITYKNMTIEATGTTYGRVVAFDNTASFDSIVNCRINAPVSASTSNNIAGIFADGLRGESNVIKNNIITNGSSGIYFRGSSTAALTFNHVIDSNTVNNSYYYGMYLGNTGRIKVTKNTVNVTMPGNSISYGMYSTSSDSAYQYVANKINITGMTNTTTYGMYFTGGNGGDGKGARIANNTIMGLTGNTGTLYGMYQTASTYNNTVNNVISILTTGTTSYGAYMTGGGGNNFLNNTVVNSSTSTSVNNVAAYLTQTSGANPSLNIQNNILSHLGGGRAMYTTNLNFIYSDYNTFYTTGATLIQWNTGNAYPTLQAWRDTSFWDLSSIAVQPSLISTSNLRPDVANPDVWAIHGRGNQVAGNDYDFDNMPRPTTLTAGVPDMGAFEFLPTALPTVLTAIPATPAPGITQTFMYATDTVMKITYAPGAPVPASINLRRYSGVLPPGLAAGQNSMYFYTDIDVPAQGAYKYSVQQYYVDSWQGFIPVERTTKLGRNNAANAWLVNANSKVDDIKNVISDTALVYMDRFTGLTDGTVPIAPVVLPARDSSNRGTRFWVGYGHHQNFTTSNTQDMVLYFSAEQAANVTVKINGTPYLKTYAVPANSVITSVVVPKSGLVDARLLIDGKSSRGISIESDVPIVAYAHIYASTTSEAAMLLPVGTYGYEYTALTTVQNYATNTYSWFYVVADNDSTKVIITPSNPTLGGSAAGVPFEVYLNKGEVYQALGAISSGNDGYDLTGSTIKSVANAGGRCFPIAVFSGSSRTNIGCGTSNPTASGDNIIEQNFPQTAWGKKYLVAPTSSSTGASSLHTNIYRVAIKNPATVVTRNGVQLTGLVNNFYYQFESNTADVIEANNPIIVAQIMASSGFCPNNSGGGDPAMVYVSPVEQGIKRVGLYRNTQSAITNQYVTLIVPDAGVTSLTIDGSNTFDHTYAHNAPGYTVVVKRWNPAANAQVIIQSDSAFTAITYGLGSVESYAYNAGTLVKNLNALPSIDNTLSTATVADYTCVNAPFRFNMLISSKPTALTWKFSALNNLVGNTDVVQNNPVAIDSTFSNGSWFYKYTVTTDYKFTSAGTFYVPILVTDPKTIEGCDNTMEVSLEVKVIPAPSVNFTGTFAACLGQPVTLNGTGSTSNGVPITSYNWTFGDATTAIGASQTKTYATAGTYNVGLRIIANDGCIGDTTKAVVINPLPLVNVVTDSLVVCGNTAATFTVQSPVTGTTYRWYAAATGGTALATGTSYTTPAVTGTVSYYLEATSAATCVSATRKKVTATLLPDLAAPVVIVDSTGIDRITFRWAAVPGALTYQVSVNGSSTWITPSSGATGLTHTVSGLLPLTDVSIRVRAVGAATCQQTTSASVTGKTLTAQIYIPNAFSPNGDGVNETLLVYGYSIRNVHFVVYNQWGEKIFESFNQATGWNGTYKGKPQPSGVYMYVCELTLRDGTTEVKKGSINLVR